MGTRHTHTEIPWLQASAKANLGPLNDILPSCFQGPALRIAMVSRELVQPQATTSLQNCRFSFVRTMRPLSAQRIMRQVRMRMMSMTIWVFKPLALIISGLPVSMLIAFAAVPALQYRKALNTTTRRNSNDLAKQNHQLMSSTKKKPEPEQAGVLQQVHGQRIPTFNMGSLLKAVVHCLHCLEPLQPSMDRRSLRAQDDLVHEVIQTENGSEAPHFRKSTFVLVVHGLGGDQAKQEGLAHLTENIVTAL